MNKLWKQKHTGKSRVHSKKSPIWKGGIKLFKSKNILKNFKINKKIWKHSLILFIFIKKSFIIIFKNNYKYFSILLYLLFKILIINNIYKTLIINFKLNIIYNKNINYYKYKFIFISYIKLLDIIKYNYIFIII